MDGLAAPVGLLGRALLILVPMILSLTVHEFAHAWAAARLGDDTAAKQGRLSLNPWVHIDAFGTIILPLMLLLSSVPFFLGWAKPVPVSASKLNPKIGPRRGMMWVAAAGPLSNLILAFVAGMGLAALSGDTSLMAASPAGLAFLRYMLGVNVALFVFNMLPVSPLDGEKVLAGILKGQAALAFERFGQSYGRWLLLGVIFFAGDILAWPIGMVQGFLLALVGL